eukprot:2470378-Rhodomonas_salina.1
MRCGSARNAGHQYRECGALALHALYHSTRNARQPYWVKHSGRVGGSGVCTRRRLEVALVQKLDLVPPPIRAVSTGERGGRGEFVPARARGAPCRWPPSRSAPAPYASSVPRLGCGTADLGLPTPLFPLCGSSRGSKAPLNQSPFAAYAMAVRTCGCQSPFAAYGRGFGTWGWRTPFSTSSVMNDSGGSAPPHARSRYRTARRVPFVCTGHRVGRALLGPGGRYGSTGDCEGRGMSVPDMRSVSTGHGVERALSVPDGRYGSTGDGEGRGMSVSDIFYVSTGHKLWQYRRWRRAGVGEYQGCSCSS